MKKRMLRRYYKFCIWWCDVKLIALHYLGKIVKRVIKWNKKIL